MFPHLAQYSDHSLLFMRFMVGLIFADSGYRDLKEPRTRGESIGLPTPLAAFIGVAELLGGIGVIIGIWPQLASAGLILVMLGALQRKIFVWKTGFWGTDGFGWYYELTLVSMLLVVLFTNGGRFVVLR
jgi:putative oxidoreductase